MSELICFISIARVNIHTLKKRNPKFFFNGINMTVVENDIAVLKVKNPHVLKCVERQIWPACLPVKVYFTHMIFSKSLESIFSL